MAHISPLLRILKDGRSIDVRNAIDPDAESYLKCLEACLQDGEGLISLPNERRKTNEEHREQIRQVFDSHNDIILLAEFEGTIVGSLDFKAQRRKRLAHTGDFGMAILPQWRGLGIGSVLLSTLIAWAKSNQSIEKLSLRVLITNTHAVALYKKFGFLEEGRCAQEIKYEDGSYADELLMARFV